MIHILLCLLLTILKECSLVIDDDERIILANYQKGELAEIMKDFIQIYVKANMFYKEKQELEEEKKRRENN